jgi:hypothetical protein
MNFNKCHGKLNNLNINFPPMMSDSRLFTKYDPAADRDIQHKKSLSIQTSYDYRNYLINNAESIIAKNKVAACDECCVCKVNLLPNMHKNKKYIYKSCTDDNKPFGYESSDLKTMYLTRKELQSRMRGPILTQEQMLHEL